MYNYEKTFSLKQENNTFSYFLRINNKIKNIITLQFIYPCFPDLYSFHGTYKIIAYNSHL